MQNNLRHATDIQHINKKGVKIFMQLPTHEGFITFHNHHTWYRIIGNLTPNTTPLLILHGGPGIPHESLQPLTQLALPSRPIIFYDQLGCGNSDHPTDLSIFTLNLFLEELSTIYQELNLHHIHLFGHSWGGMLALEYALRYPTHLKSLTLASTPANIPHMFATQQHLWSQLPPHILNLLQSSNPDDTQQAHTYFEQHHYCRCSPWPDFLIQARSPHKRNIQLNRHMWHPSDTPNSGTLANWNIIPHLHTITLPTLITAGQHDGIAIQQDPILHQHLPNSQHVIFPNSSHYPHAEETTLYLNTLDHFLNFNP